MPRPGLLLAGLLLAGHGLARALTGTRVGVCALTAHRKAAAVPDALVATDFDFAPDVGGNLAAQVALDPVVGLNEVTESNQVLVRQVTNAGVRAEPGPLERRQGTGP